MDALQRWLTLLSLAAAALAAIGYLVRQVWRGFQLVQKVHDLVEHELSHNGGTSMKDDLAAVARNVGELQADFHELTTAKRLAHELLQMQLDDLAEEIGVTPRHRKASE